MMFYAIRVEIDCCFNLMQMKYNWRMPVCQKERRDANFSITPFSFIPILFLRSRAYSFRIRSSSRSMR